MTERVSASFRDPAGFLFTRGGQLYRQVNQAGAADYELMMSSGLYKHLVKQGWMVPHQEVDAVPARPEIAHKVLQPERVPFISYPYEWCFSQLQDAALLTLQIQKAALERGLVLKDASAYNIQFRAWQPLLIDTLSFEKYEEGRPWTAYRQFCQHFLAPLALMAKVDVRLSQLLRVYIDGIPLDLAAELLPWNTRLNLGLATHILLHAAAQRKYAGQAVKQPTSARSFSKISMLGLIDSLESSVRALSWKPAGTEWGDYYGGTNYSGAAFQQKQTAVSELIAQAKPAVVWDLGANTGLFSRLASAQGAQTLAFDIDPAAVEKAYRQAKAEKTSLFLPLVLDLTNPSPAIGWMNAERLSLAQRGPADLVMALALVHHLAISNNVPLPGVAEMLAGLGRWLIIEFVPKSDSQVQRLLASRADIFDQYTQESFEKAFGEKYIIRQRRPVEGSQRTLYFMELR